MRKTSRLLPALGVLAAVLTLPASYLILRFVPSYPVEIAALAVGLLLATLAVLGYLATKRGQAAAFVAIALVLPYLLIGTVLYGGLERASSEIGSLFEEDGSVPDEELFEDEGLFEEEGGTYGSDPELDALQDDCVAGDQQACDELFFSAPTGSEYESTAEEYGGGP